MNAGHLVVTIHDVSPVSLPRVRQMRDGLAKLGIERVTLLAVPNFHGAASLCESPDTVAWLRERRRAGDEIALHGREHRQRNPIPGRVDRLRARLLTAGEGECLAASGPEIEEMLVKGKRELEELIDARVAGFVAPAWLEPRGFGEHLRRHGFGWHEGSLWMEALGTEPPQDRRRFSPVIGFATRTTLRRLAGLAWSRVLGFLLEGTARRRGAPIRVALHPHDWTSAVVERTTGLILSRLARQFPAVTTEAALAKHN